MDDSLPGAHTLARIDFTMVIDIKTIAYRQRNILIRKVGGINLEDLLPCPYIFRRRIRVFLPLLRIPWQLATSSLQKPMSVRPPQ